MKSFLKKMKQAWVDGWKQGQQLAVEQKAQRFAVNFLYDPTTELGQQNLKLAVAYFQKQNAQQKQASELN